MKRNLLFLSKNLLKMALLLLCVSMVAFFLVSVSPINPLQANVGQTALGSMSPEQIQKLEEYWGVGQPPVERYLAWAGDVLRGDMGTSLIYRQSVASVIGQRLQNSLWLLVIAWALSGTIGFFLGAVAGANRGGIWDRLIKSYSLITASTPAFWLALLPVSYTHLDVYKRQVSLSRHPADRLQNASLIAKVQIRGGFIKQNGLGFLCHGPGDGALLALPAADLGIGLIGQMFDAQLRQHPPYGLPVPVPWTAKKTHLGGPAHQHKFKYRIGKMCIRDRSFSTLGS